MLCISYAKLQNFHGVFLRVNLYSVHMFIQGILISSGHAFLGVHKKRMLRRYMSFEALQKNFKKLI